MHGVRALHTETEMGTGVPHTHAPPDVLQEQNYFFRMEKYRPC